MEGLKREEVEYVRGQMIQAVFHNVENLYSVIRFQVEEASSPSEKNIVVAGYFPLPHEEEWLIFYGDWQNHPKYGRQFIPQYFERVKPSSREGVIKYLSSDLFPGIGVRTAEKLVDHFGDHCLEIISQEPERLAEVSGISMDKINTLQKGIAENHMIEQLMVFLYPFGIGPQLVNRIYQAYSEEALQICKHNPFQLIEDVEGIGFQRADRIAQALGMAPDAPERQRAAILYVLQEECQRNGHVFLLDVELLEKALELIQPEQEAVAITQITQMLGGLVADDKLIMDEERVYLPSLYFSERGVAQALSRISSQEATQTFTLDELYKSIGRVEEQHGITYSEKQREAIELAMKASILILTGGPGTGKTTVIRGICEVFSDLYGHSLDPEDYRDPDGDPYPVRLIAPTGRAAKRMAESTGLPAMTIHRMLGWNGEGVQYDEENPVSGKLFIIDESSMVDTYLAFQLLRALPDQVKVILVGDVHQLPSVGPGRVLQDIIQSELIPVITLDTIYRQAEGSSIIQLAHAIREGHCPEDILEKQNDRAFLACSSTQLLDVVKQVCQNALSKGFEAKELQVLAPMYRGVLGIDNLNQELQALFNPPSEEKREINWHDTVFRTGDKVLQLVNDPNAGVYNGDMGEVVAILQPGEQDADAETLVVDFDGIEVRYEKKDANQLTLSYCCSIHKAQGSEFSMVIIPLSRQYYRMLRRNLIYTAVTRGKSYLILCGELAAFQHGIQRTDEGKRYTYLCERLQNISIEG
ncbi:SF1B family DNA helicase RecD2 [Rubeoparvulum massiliense]|uniref:SF1B family DNA helicase RecD2 n=1 Tax=Rubeoparvulum massiliense TaxID=1631346 RepID=UPI00065DC175|nr:ATP-dependent RecD-like DNA helicase [Rubeoparvulum massiliense]